MENKDFLSFFFYFFPLPSHNYYTIIFAIFKQLSFLVLLLCVKYCASFFLGNDFVISFIANNLRSNLLLVTLVQRWVSIFRPGQKPRLQSTPNVLQGSTGEVQAPHYWTKISLSTHKAVCTRTQKHTSTWKESVNSVFFFKENRELSCEKKLTCQSYHLKPQFYCFLWFQVCV